MPLAASSNPLLIQSTHFLYAWPIEWVVLGGLLVIVVLGTMRSGTGAATALALAFPLAGMFYTELPAAALLGPIVTKFTEPASQAAIFVTLFVVVLLMTYRIVTCFDSLTGGGVFGVLGAISVGIMLLVTWQQVPTLNSIWHISAPLQALFAEQYRFWWSLAAMGLLTYVRS